MRNCVFPNKTLEMYVQVATIEVLEVLESRSTFG